MEKISGYTVGRLVATVETTRIGLEFDSGAGYGDHLRGLAGWREIGVVVGVGVCEGVIGRELGME